MNLKDYIADLMLPISKIEKLMIVLVVNCCNIDKTDWPELFEKYEQIKEDKSWFIQSKPKVYKAFDDKYGSK